MLVNARLAADAVGATKMDRPEWCAVHPVTGEVYYTLTNNSNRKVEPASSSQMAVDAANPRSYTDAPTAAASPGNVNGHIIRMKENAGDSAATAFTWDVYLFGAQADADLAKVNLSALTADQDFSSPDGLWFSPKTGLCFIQTDDGAYTDVTNCMMLIGKPGQVGDGSDADAELHQGATAARSPCRPVWAPSPRGHAAALPGRPEGLRDHRAHRDAGRQGRLRQYPAPRRDHQQGQRCRPDEVPEPLAWQRGLRRRRRERPSAFGDDCDHAH